MDALIDKGVAIHSITLHVGAGTFRNLRSEDLDRGTLHSEWFEIPDDTVEAIREAKRTGGRVTAVGTTVTRALESAALVDGAVRPGSGETSLFIQSGFQFRVVDRMMTNFHLPRTSLLILVCAFGGRDRVLAGYSQAVRLGYRFYSYGDAMLLNREDLDRS
jgi:S-adenosylmethionine:tRNA ribosyltransferase-isomerase